jgi:hypothetical protein
MVGGGETECNGTEKAENNMFGVWSMLFRFSSPLATWWGGKRNVTGWLSSSEDYDRLGRKGSFLVPLAIEGQYQDVRRKSIFVENSF